MPGTETIQETKKIGEKYAAVTKHTTFVFQSIEWTLDWIDMFEQLHACTGTRSVDFGHIQ